MANRNDDKSYHRMKDRTIITNNQLHILSTNLMLHHHHYHHHSWREFSGTWNKSIAGQRYRRIFLYLINNKHKHQYLNHNPLYIHSHTSINYYSNNNNATTPPTTISISTTNTTPPTTTTISTS